MNKKVIGYYDQCNYTLKNKELLDNLFETYILFKNEHVITYDVEAIFVPYGFTAAGPELRKQFPDIKFVVSNTTTPVRVLDNSVDVIHLRDGGMLQKITPTAEHTLGLILAAHRNLRQAIDHTYNGAWNRYELGAPKMLSRSTLVIVGEGRVGRMLGKYACTIFEKVLFIRENHWGDNPQWVEKALSQADVLAICASYEGKEIIGDKELSKLPQHSIVVNTSDGRNLDTVALINHLRLDKIRGAALDVLPNDWGPLGKNEVYQQVIKHLTYSKNLILTPHIAGSTEDAWAETQEWVIREAYRRLHEK